MTNRFETPSERYWKARIREDEEYANSRAQEAGERIRKMYEVQYKKVVVKLEGLMAQVQDGKELSRTKLWNYSRWRELEKSLSSFVTGGALIERETIHGCLDDVFERVIGVKVDGLAAENFTPNIDPKTIIDTAWSGDRFSNIVWKNRAAVAQRVRIDIEDMIVQGRGLSDMRAELMHEFTVGYKQADRLLRTEMSYVLNRSHIERYKTRGIERVRWAAKNREIKRCEICREGNGQTFTVEEAEGKLPAHPYCGCRWVPDVSDILGSIPVSAESTPKEMDRAFANAENKGTQLKIVAGNGTMSINPNAVADEAKKTGGRHNGKYQDAVKWPDKSLTRSAKSLQKTIMEHVTKIEQPAQVIPEWDQLDPRAKEGYVYKWGKDISRNAELLAVIRAILKERGLLS